VGDNRDNSTDSRALSALGYVPLDNLVGRGRPDLLLTRARLGWRCLDRSDGADRHDRAVREGRTSPAARALVFRFEFNSQPSLRGSSQ